MADRRVRLLAEPDGRFRRQLLELESHVRRRAEATVRRPRGERLADGPIAQRRIHRQTRGRPCRPRWWVPSLRWCSMYVHHPYCACRHPKWPAWAFSSVARKRATRRLRPRSPISFHPPQSRPSQRRADLVPGAQQGGGIVQAWDPAYEATLIDACPDSPSTTTGSTFSGDGLSLTNAGNRTITYKSSYVPAASYHMMNNNGLRRSTLSIVMEESKASSLWLAPPCLTLLPRS